MRVELTFDAGVFDDIKHLIEANWEASGIGLEINLEHVRANYAAFGQVGFLTVATAYDGDKPIGYAAATVTPHVMNHSVRFANVSGFYILPEYRRGLAGGRIAAALKRHFREKGVDHIMWHAPANSEFEMALFKRHKRVNSYFMEKLS